MTEPCPIKIAGGGLAGLSLGIALRSRGIPVTVLESGQYPRHRVCGEFISGVTGDDLSKLTIPDLLENAVPNVSTSWFDGNRCFLENELPTAAMGISRFALDQDLANRFTQADGDLQTGVRFSSSEPVSPGTVLAVGRPRRQDSQWIGLKAHLHGFDLHTDLEMHLSEGGYLGISRVEDGIANACGLFRIRKSLKASRTELLGAYLEACGLSDLVSRIRKADTNPESCLGVSAFELGHQLSQKSDGQEELRLGDQFAIIGPFTGNGMSMAFQSAALALDPISEYSRGNLSWRDCCGEVSRLLQSSFRKRLALSGLIHPFLTGKARQKILVQFAGNRLIPFSLLFKQLR